MKSKKRELSCILRWRTQTFLKQQFEQIYWSPSAEWSSVALMKLKHSTEKVLKGAEMFVGV